MTDIQELRERLNDPASMFTQSEAVQLFEALHGDYGYYRSPDLAPPRVLAQTAALTVPYFEDLGVLLVRSRTNEDSLITIPNLVDKLLKDNQTPTAETLFNIRLVALASTVIVSPPNFVERLMAEDDSVLVRDTEEEGAIGKKQKIRRFFFLEFVNEYQRWIEHRNEEAKAKKSGSVSGTELVS